MNAMRLLLPVLLGGIAAILNFLVLQGSIAPVELTVLRTEVKADTELTPEMLQPLAVRADKDVFKSAVPYAERGLLLGRRVMRPINAGEAVLYTDVQNLDEENIRLYLKPGETTLTVSVKSSRVAPGLRRGDSIGVVVTERPTQDMKTRRTPNATTRMLGPFRLLSIGRPVDGYRGTGIGEVRQLLVAIKPGPNGQLDPMSASLQAVLSAGSYVGSGNENGVLSVEYYQGTK